MTHVVWGVELSPFVLKLEALLAFGNVPFRRLPRDGGRLENLRVARRIERAKRERTVLRYPRMDDLDEYPLVPFLVSNVGEILYDSSAIACWLDDQAPDSRIKLIPDPPALRFVTNLIDEFFDEVGLYLVHHNRWKVAALDNDRPGLRLAREYRKFLPPIPGVAARFGSWFERRQVRRLPYLFSFAPAGYRRDGLAPSLTPPSRADFPPTHELLEEIWVRTVDACDAILGRRPYLLGERFTLADASAYGQLSMNLTDPAAARLLRERSPTVFTWLEAIRDRRHVAPRGELSLESDLTPLLETIVESFVPLMHANERAYVELRQDGATRFNEGAFDAGASLYDGEILGHPFRSVAKTFQVRAWRDLVAQWRVLSNDARNEVQELLPRHPLISVFDTRPTSGVEAARPQSPLSS